MPPAHVDARCEAFRHGSSLPTGDRVEAVRAYGELCNAPATHMALRRSPDPEMRHAWAALCATHATAIASPGTSYSASLRPYAADVVAQHPRPERASRRPRTTADVVARAIGPSHPDYGVPADA